jgi:hypothetical protein
MTTETCMNDYQIVKLCAEAMGYKTNQGVIDENDRLHICLEDKSKFTLYDPLHDDAQCMALIKRFNLRIDRDRGIPTKWGVYSKVNFDDIQFDTDLNRAVCLAVARMQAAQ